MLFIEVLLRYSLRLSEEGRLNAPRNKCNRVRKECVNAPDLVTLDTGVSLAPEEQ
jgi:hypothetical protein